jgi:hypothetical protein
MCYFLIAQMNEGRFGATSILSPAGIAAMHAPGVPTEDGSETYGLGWVTGSIGVVPVVHHDGGHPNARMFLFIEPGARRGAVLLFNSSGVLSESALAEIKVGVARLLAGQEPGPASSLSLPTLYLIVDLALAVLLALALSPLLRLRRWDQRLRQNQQAGCPWRLRVRLRLGWEFGVPVAVLSAVRQVLDMLGAQSWYEGLTLLPDFIAWLWTIALVVLLTGVLHAVLVLRAPRRMPDVRSVRISPSAG